MSTPTISEAARRAFLDAYAKACQTSKPEDWHNAALLAKQWDHALDSANPAPKEGEPEKCEVCGGDEPCSHDFDKIGWPTPSTPSLQSVAEGAANEIQAVFYKESWGAVIPNPATVKEILTRHFSPLLTERDERIGRLEEAREDALQALGEHPESETDLAQRIREIRQEGRDLFHDITALRTRCEEMQRDKERLDWLDNHISIQETAEILRLHYSKCHEIRTALDAARKEGQQAHEKGEGV